MHVLTALGYKKKKRKVEVKLKCSDVEKSSDILLLSGKNSNTKLHTVHQEIRHGPTK